MAIKPFPKKKSFMEFALVLYNFSCIEKGSSGLVSRWSGILVVGGAFFINFMTGALIWFRLERLTIPATKFHFNQVPPRGSQEF